MSCPHRNNLIQLFLIEKGKSEWMEKKKIFYEFFSFSFFSSAQLWKDDVPYLVGGKIRI
jgi:hypothetical protein